MFSRLGIPDIVISNNGPQYACDAFKQFAAQYSFTHTTSSPRYPQCNGEAERAVRTVKNIMEKSEDPFLGLLAYRTAPLHNGLTPSELVMGRNLRTTLPILPSVLEKRVDDEDRETAERREETSNELQPSTQSLRTAKVDRGRESICERSKERRNSIYCIGKAQQPPFLHSED